MARSAAGAGERPFDQGIAGEGRRERDPRAVRTWPEQHMLGFSRKVLPDTDLDALIAYLRAMAQPNSP